MCLNCGIMHSDLKSCAEAQLEYQHALLLKVLEAAKPVIADHENGMDEDEKADCVCPRCVVIRLLKAAVEAARKALEKGE